MSNKLHELKTRCKELGLPKCAGAGVTIQWLTEQIEIATAGGLVVKPEVVIRGPTERTKAKGRSMEETTIAKLNPALYRAIAPLVNESKFPTILAISPIDFWNSLYIELETLGVESIKVTTYKGIIDSINNREVAALLRTLSSLREFVNDLPRLTWGLYKSISDPNDMAMVLTATGRIDLLDKPISINKSMINSIRDLDTAKTLYSIDKTALAVDESILKEAFVEQNAGVLFWILASNRLSKGKYQNLFRSSVKRVDHSMALWIETLLYAEILDLTDETVSKNLLFCSVGDLGLFKMVLNNPNIKLSNDDYRLWYEVKPYITQDTQIFDLLLRDGRLSPKKVVGGLLNYVVQTITPDNYLLLDVIMTYPMELLTGGTPSSGIGKGDFLPLIIAVRRNEPKLIEKLLSFPVFVSSVSPQEWQSILSGEQFVTPEGVTIEEHPILARTIVKLILKFVDPEYETLVKIIAGSYVSLTSLYLEHTITPPYDNRALRTAMQRNLPSVIKMLITHNIYDTSSEKSVEELLRFADNDTKGLLLSKRPIQSILGAKRVKEEKAKLND